jgi:imidazolonepropionase-like amidohydrolase
VDVPGAQVIDLRNATVMPGLIDMHVHLGGLDDRMQARLQENFRDDEDEAFTALLNARKTLLAGFTTVRDLGGDPRTILSLRDAINANQFAGPTIVSAARMVSISAGHGDPRNGANRDIAELLSTAWATCATGRTIAAAPPASRSEPAPRSSSSLQPAGCCPTFPADLPSR